MSTVNKEQLGEAIKLLRDACSMMTKAEAAMMSAFEDLDNYEHLSGYFSGVILTAHHTAYNAATNMEDELDYQRRLDDDDEI